MRRSLAFGFAIPVITLAGASCVAKSPAGVWAGRRDIVLGLNIPDYR